MKPLVIGILPQAEIRARALAIASGKYKPRPGEPKIWCTSMSRYGLVELRREKSQVKPIVKAQEFRIVAVA